MATYRPTIKEIIGYYERQLPRKENYSKRPLAYLEKKEKELMRQAKDYQKLLDRPDRCSNGRSFADDEVTQAFVTMFKDHRQVALHAIAAKRRKAA